MRANIIRHESKIARDHKKLGQILQWIRLQPDGIKRGNLIVKSGIPFNQWQFWHTVLIDLDEIDWDKASHTYSSMREKKEFEFDI